MSNFDPSTVTFSFENIDNYNLAGPTSTSYKFTVSAATVDTVSQVKASATFNLLVKHPCLDADFTPTSLAVSPDQRNPDPYFYTEQAAFIKIESFISDPALCAV